MEFITNRTVQDVQLANAVRMVKVQKGKPLTQDDIEHLERGTLTINTLNRLENSIVDLAQLLADEYYFVNVGLRKSWNYTDIFDSSDQQRFLSQVDAFHSFYNGNDMPTTPTYMYSWQNMNAVESILAKTFERIEKMKLNAQYCGTFNCGDENNE